MPTVNDLPLLSCTLVHPRIGRWSADVEADGEEALEGSAAIDLGGDPFVGTVVRSGVTGGRVQARIVGGAGGLATELKAQNYATGTVRVRAILDDILRGAGETLASGLDDALLSRQLPKWQRSAGPASHALVRLLDAIGATWRMTRAGTVWVGVDTYPEADPDHVLVDEDWHGGVMTIAVEEATLDPGTTFRGHRIEQVTHRLTRNALRTDAHLTTAQSSLDRFLGGIRSQIDYSRLYPCRVGKQNADGTLELTPDDERMKGRGLDKVPIRHGLPGIKSVKVPSGTRVHVGFDAGDPSRPFAALWDAGAVTSIEIGEDAADVARKGDIVEVLVPPAVFTGTIMVQGSPSPATGVVSWVVPKLLGTIILGSPRLRAGT